MLEDLFSETGHNHDRYDIPERSAGTAITAEGERAWRVLEGDRPPLFSGILQRDYKIISAQAHAKEFARGETLYMEGFKVQQVIMLTSGLVKITKLGLGGTEVILRLAGPGEVLGIAGSLLNSTHGTTAQAFRLCRALAWELPVFRGLIEPFPIMQQNLAGILGRQLLELEDRFREVATERVALRVARQVVRLVEQIGHPLDGAIEIGLSREELAQMTGTTLFTVSRLFSTWEALGIMKPRREAVLIIDMKRLHAISEDQSS